MGIDECIKKVDAYLKKENVQPFIIDVQNKEEMSAIVTHYNVGTNAFLPVSEYCSYDEFPRIDDFINDITNKQGTIFVTGLSVFLMLKGERELKETLSEILSLNIQGHVVIITVQCRRFFDFNDPRLNNRLFIFNTIESLMPNLVFTDEQMIELINKDYVIGLNSIAYAYETLDKKVIYVKSKKKKSCFPMSLIQIRDLNNSYAALCLNDILTEKLPESFGTEKQWKYALTKFKSGASWISVIDREFIGHKSLGNDISNYRFYDDNKKWLYFIALKLFGAKNNWVIDTATKNANDSNHFVRQIFRSLLDVNPEENNFNKYYKQRKTIINQLGNPIDEVVDFCKIVGIKEKYAIYYLTDNTQQEKELIISFLDKYKEYYNRKQIYDILKVIYPDLYAYLSDYRFNIELLDRYFSDYKYQKVVNNVSQDFLDVVNEQAKKREFTYLLPPRSSVIDKIDYNDSKIFFIDALGVEYLGYIVSICSEMGMIVNAKIGCCDLPSITSMNKDFIEKFIESNYSVTSIKDLDEIKHHGKGDCDFQKTRLPIYIIKELETIRDIISKINVQLMNDSIKKAIIVSDHGASRLAVLNDCESAITMNEKGEHSGRCCLKSDIDVHPENAVDAGAYWSLADYERFKGGRKANVEVHGGATLEEVVVPIIEITKQPENAEIRIITPNILVSYKKRASIRFFSKSKIRNVAICVNSKYYDAYEIDDKIYQVDMPEIKKPGRYFFDILTSNYPIAKDLSFEVEKEGAKEKNLF